MATWILRFRVTLVVLLSIGLQYGCTAANQVNHRVPSPTPAKPTEVADLDVQGLYEAAKNRAFEVTWHISGGDKQLSLVSNGEAKAGIRPNGDRYLLQKDWNGFLHVGNQSWYLTRTEHNQLKADGPYAGHLNQLPYMHAWEALSPTDLGLLDVIWGVRGTLVRTTTDEGEQWIMDPAASIRDQEPNAPSGTKPAFLHGGTRFLTAYRLEVRKHGNSSLPATLYLRWRTRESSQEATLTASFSWEEPTFPEP